MNTVTKTRGNLLPSLALAAALSFGAAGSANADLFTFGSARTFTEEATSAWGAIVQFTMPQYTYAGLGIPTITGTPASGSVFAIGTTTLSWMASDDLGYRQIFAEYVNVSDTTAPVFLELPANITVTQTSAEGAVVFYGLPSASDSVDFNVLLTSNIASGSMFSPGLTQVMVTAADHFGNASTTSFNVTVLADTPVAVPEPVSLALFGAAFLGLGFARRKRTA